MRLLCAYTTGARKMTSFLSTTNIRAWRVRRAVRERLASIGVDEVVFHSDGTFDAFGQGRGMWIGGSVQQVMDEICQDKDEGHDAS